MMPLPRFELRISDTEGPYPEFTEVSIRLKFVPTGRELDLTNGFVGPWTFYTASYMDELPFTPSQVLSVIGKAIHDDVDGNYVAVICGEGGLLKLQFSDITYRRHIVEVITLALTTAGYEPRIVFDQSVTWAFAEV